MCVTCPYFLDDSAGMDCLYCEKHFDDSFEGNSIPDWCELPKADTLPSWAIDAIEKEISGLWEEYAKTGMIRFDACARKLEWVLSLRKPEEKE